jgi:hypothetical protein
MNANEIARRLDEIAGEGVPADADLWPQLRAQVGTKRVRRGKPRRRAGALLAAAVMVLALALGAFTPAGTNAATGALGLVGLQPIGMASGAPSCVGPDGNVDPTYAPAAAGTFAIAGGSGEAQPSGAAAVQAMQITCPEGYELSFDLQPVESNAVLKFFGVTTLNSTSNAPSCVGEGGSVAAIQTDVDPSLAVPSSMPVPAGTVGGIEPVLAATQISCPAGYTLTVEDK